MKGGKKKGHQPGFVFEVCVKKRDGKGRKGVGINEQRSTGRPELVEIDRSAMI